MMYVMATGYGVMLLIFGLIFACGFWLVAGRMGRNKWIWAILAIVPFVNFFFYIYATFAILLYVLDRLNAVSTARTQP